MPTHRQSFDLVIGFLGVTLVLCVAGGIALALDDKPIPGMVENVALACLAAIAGLLARTPTQETVPVRIEGDDR